jgi:hypothetical protein
MNTARSISLAPECDPTSSEGSGQYRMVQPRARRQRAHNNAEYLGGPHAVPVNGASLNSLPVKSAPAKSASTPIKSVKPKVVSLLSLDDAFEDERMDESTPTHEDEWAEQNAPDAPDSLVQMMEGLEGTKVKEEAAWPKEMPSVPRPPSVPKMEAIRPIQPPISKMTPGPVNEHQVIGEFAKFGPPPTSIWQTIGYMFHVRARKEQLRQELGLYRERRTSDVDLYEKALRHVDDDAVRRGIMLLAGGGVLGVLVIVMICVLL